MKLFTSSRAKCARACQRRHHYEYVLGYRPAVTADALRFGTLGHLGLEAWWKTPASPLAGALAAIHAHPDVDPYDLAKAEVLLTAYHARWCLEQYEALGVEVQFEAPLVNPETGAPSRVWRMAGKLDGIIRDSSGRVLILEHKFVSADISPGSDYWARLKLDGQISQYYAGARALGYDPQGVLYDVILKPKLKPCAATPPDKRKYTKEGNLYSGQREQDETPDEYRARLIEDMAAAPDRYFARAEVVRLEAEEREFQFDAWQLARQMHEAEKAGMAPKNPESCFSYGQNCPFLPVCTGESALENTARYVRLDAVNPELEEEKKP